MQVKITYVRLFGLQMLHISKVDPSNIIYDYDNTTISLILTCFTKKNLLLNGKKT